MSQHSNDNNAHIWFPAKRYGWGWGFPVKWQGWLVLTFHVVLVLELVGRRSHMARAKFILYLRVATAGLIAVCWLKGEKPRWRWGKRANK